MVQGRHRALVALVAALVLATAACGTRVDETAVASSGGSFGATGPGAAGVDGGLFEDGTVGGGTAASGSGANRSARVAGQGTTSGRSGSNGGSGSAGTGGSGQPASGAPIVIGAVGTRSGVVGASQEPHWVGLFTWLKWINDQGGIGGRPVKLVMVDDGGDPGRHAAAVRRLIEEEGVVAFVGSAAPITFSAGVPVLEENGIPAIGGDSAEQGWFTSPIVFPFNGGALPEGRAMGKFSATLPETRAAIFYLGEVEFGKIYTDYVKEGWQAAGKEIVLESSISLAQPDFTSEVLRARSAGAEVIITATDQSGCRRFLDSASRQNYRPKWLMPINCADPIVAGSDQIGSVFNSARNEVSTADVPGMELFRQAVKRYAPDSYPPPTHMVLGWGSGRLFELAVEEAGGNTEPQALIEAMHRLRDVTLDGLIHPISFPPGPQPEKPCGKIMKFDTDNWYAITDFLC